MRDERSSPPTRARRITFADVARLLSAWGVASVTLLLADAVQPNLSADSPWALVAVAAVSGIVGLFVRPLLVVVTRSFSKQLYTRTRDNQDAIGEMSEQVQGSIAGVRVVR